MTTTTDDPSRHKPPRKEQQQQRGGGKMAAALFLGAVLAAALPLAMQPQGAQAFVPPPAPFRLSATTTTKATTTALPLPFFGARRARGASRVVTMSTKGGANNQMSPEAYTEKAWDAITRLPQLATRFEAQYIDTEVLLKSLLEDGPASLANRIFFKAGVKLSLLETDLDAYIAGQPRVPDAQNKVI